MRLRIETMTAADLAYVAARLRDYDRRELAVQGYGDQQFADHLDQAYSYALKLDDGTPVAVGGAIRPEEHAAFRDLQLGGAVPFNNRLFVWGFGTPEAERYMLDIHKASRAFLAFLDDVEWQRSQTVLVWAGHQKSIRWLRHLGFRKTGIEFAGLTTERIFLMERL